MKRLLTMAWALCAGAALAEGTLVVKSVTAQQRYPWNGKVDIVVTIQGDTNAIAQTECLFAATNCATKAAVPVTAISQVGSDSVVGDVCTRCYLWDSTNDVGEVKIDDLALTVDIQNPSGVQLWENGPYWAACNVGATKPEEDGYYFCWGDTEGYQAEGGIAVNYGWYECREGVAWLSSSGIRVQSSPFTSSLWSADEPDTEALLSLGYINSNGNLVVSRDAATVHLGAPWRMPSDEEFVALETNCTTTVITLHGTVGRLVTGKGVYASKSIFLPASGRGGDFSVEAYGWEGHYWSATFNSKYVDCDEALSALCFESYFDYFELECDHSLYYGQSIRPVRESFKLVGATSHIKLDNKTETRGCSTNGTILCYNVAWYEKAASISIYDNGIEIDSGTSETLRWYPETLGNHVLQLTAFSNSGEQVGAESAEFFVGTGYTVRFVTPEGKGTMSDQLYTCGKVHQLPTCTFRNGSRRFRGWWCEQTNRRYDDGCLVFNLAEPGETVTMTAIWE